MPQSLTQPLNQPGRFGWLRRLWPRSLLGRLAMIQLVGLIAAHLLAFGWIRQERAELAETMMVAGLGREIAAAIALLDRLPPEERAKWLPQLHSRNHRFSLGKVSAPPLPANSPPITGRIIDSIGGQVGRERIAASGVALHDGEPSLQLEFQLADGSPLTLSVFRSPMPVSTLTLSLLGLQWLVLAVFAALAVRQATRPLSQLAAAVDALGPELQGPDVPETGPREVVRAAAAFNAMQRRIRAQVAERLQILAAVSHDLQTPITRMRLRAELLDDDTLRDKFQSDLAEMQRLVEDGLAYARNGYGLTEPRRKVDLDALLDTLRCDYTDAGHPVALQGTIGRPLSTQPRALRRVLVNLIDNALKFAGEAEVAVAGTPETGVQIAIRDRGPGIPPEELKAVLQPFYRVERSRNRETGGSGLGLAIAQQMARGLGGKLELCNREEGGLEVRLSLPGEVAANGLRGEAA